MAKAVRAGTKIGPSDMVMAISLMGILGVLRSLSQFSTFFLFIPSPLQEHQTICFTSNPPYTPSPLKSLMLKLLLEMAFASSLERRFHLSRFLAPSQTGKEMHCFSWASIALVHPNTSGGRCLIYQVYVFESCAKPKDLNSGSDWLDF